MTPELVSVEIRRLLRHPVLWCAAGMTLALMFWVNVRQPTLPNLGFEQILAATGAFVVALAMTVVANLATLRDQRNGMPETLAALPGGPSTRTRALALSVASTAAVLAILVIVPYLLVRAACGPVAGRFDVVAVLASVTAVALLAVLGVVLGRWLPSLIAAPAFLLVFVVLSMQREIDLWFLPVTTILAGDVLEWRSSLRLLYLLAAIVLAMAVGLLRHGVTLRRAVAALAALAVMAPLLWLAPTSARSAIEGGAAEDLACLERAGVTYCHQPGFASWVPLWAAAVEPVAAALPERARDRLPTVRQYHSTVQPYGEPQHRDGQVGEEWGRGALELEYRTMLAGRVAAESVGLAGAGARAAEGATCDGGGQARTVVALWLAGHAAAVPPAAQRDPLGATHLGEVVYGERDERLARQLLTRADARARIGEHWDALVDPGTTVDEALIWLGLEPGHPVEPATAPPCR